VAARDEILAPKTAAEPAVFGLADVAALASSGVSDDVILNQMRTTGTTFALRTEDIIFLKRNKVSDRVVIEMQNSRSRHLATETGATGARSAAQASVATPSLYLRCSESVEFTNKSRKGRDKTGKEIEVKWQEMRAVGNVRIRIDNLEASAEIVTYSEDKSLLAFYGSTKNPAVLTRRKQECDECTILRGEKITFNLKTKEYSVEGARR
jgi:hypothetical protein